VPGSGGGALSAACDGDCASRQALWIIDQLAPGQGGDGWPRPAVPARSPA